MKTAIIATPGGPEVHTLPVVVDEARKVGMPVFTKLGHGLKST